MSPEALAALHARCFVAPAPWSAGAFADTLSLPGTFLLTRGARAFLVGRAIAGEAELLTLAVDPASRRMGLGHALSAEFAGKARQMGATAAYLEVAAGNLAARRLYSGLGWLEVGVRRRYYGPASDAIVMRLAADMTQEGG